MSSARSRVGAAVAGLALASLAIVPAARADSSPRTPPTASATASATASPGATATASPSATPVAGVHLAAPAVTGTTGRQAADAAHFVAATLAAGGHHYVYPGTASLDGGNTVDAILALDGVGVGRDEAAAAAAYLVAHLGDYVGAGGETYAGPTAKALLAVLAQGLDPHDVGGTDLLARLAGLETSSGRFSDVSAWGDYSNTIGQSLAVIALARAGETVSGTAVAYLAGLQCPDGGFTNDPAAEVCESDPDATAFAVQALLSVSVPTLDTSAAAAAGLDYLTGIQTGAGGVASSTGGPNANSTGVAAQAFAAGGRASALAAAQSFLAGLQYDCSYAARLRGGIAFQASDRAARSATAPADTDLRATPQAALGLAGGTLAAVTSDGAVAGTTAPVCAARTSSTSSAGSAEPAAATTAGSTAGSTAGDPGSLAYTGALVGGPLLLAALLVLGGLTALVTGSLLRRRGAHS